LHVACEVSKEDRANILTSASYQSK
jgi:hypothetical protein